MEMGNVQPCAIPAAGPSTALAPPAPNHKIQHLQHRVQISKSSSFCCFSADQHPAEETS